MNAKTTTTTQLCLLTNKGTYWCGEAGEGEPYSSQWNSTSSVAPLMWKILTWVKVFSLLTEFSHGSSNFLYHLYYKNSFSVSVQSRSFIVTFTLVLTLYVLNFSEGTKTYPHFISFRHIDLAQVVEIFPKVRREVLIYSTQSIWWVLMSWRCKEPGHQQPWYWPS